MNPHLPLAFSLSLDVGDKIDDIHFSCSKDEKKVARAAFEKAYQRECSSIIDTIRKKAVEIKEPDNIWRLHDYLTKKRDGIDEKYDYRDSQRILVFARLVS